MKLETGVQKALTWILAELKANPKADRATLIDQAGMRFHLTPLQSETLYRHFANAPDATGAQ
jgi:hypothetical protein